MFRLIPPLLLITAGAIPAFAQDRTLPAGDEQVYHRQMLQSAPSETLGAPVQQGRSEAIDARRPLRHKAPRR